MTFSIDPPIVAEMLRQQGISLPPERQKQVAETASRLASTRFEAEKRLCFADDVYGFRTTLHQWTKQR